MVYGSSCQAAANFRLPSPTAFASQFVIARPQRGRGALSAKREEVPLGCNFAVPGRITGKSPANMVPLRGGASRTPPPTRCVRSAMACTSRKCFPEIATSLCSSQSSRFLNTTINENAETARSAGGYPPDVPHQFREFRSSMLSSGRQTASILIRLVLPDLPFVMPPVITTLSPGCRCIVSRAARSA